MQRSITHKVKAQEKLNALVDINVKRGKHSKDDIARAHNLRKEFAAAVVGLELVYNALTAMVQRYEGK
jgi:hypothetical protein